MRRPTAQQLSLAGLVDEINVEQGYCYTIDVQARLGGSYERAYERLRRLAARGLLVADRGTFPQTGETRVYWHTPGDPANP
jgi:hypothetical protein